MVAPTRDGGTGGQLRRPASVIATAYGVGSARAHRRLAARAGLEATVLDVEGLALDVDTVEQLEALRRRHPGVATLERG